MDQSKSIAKKMKKNLDYKNIDYLMKSIACFFFSVLHKPFCKSFFITFLKILIEFLRKVARRLFI